MPEQSLRWQWRPASETRWQWLPLDTQLLTGGSKAVLAAGFPFEPEVDLDAMTISVDGTLLGDLRQVPAWWGEDANLAAGVLVACQTDDSCAELLLGVENRPWWPSPQAGPFWGFVDPEDADLRSAMAREAAEETLEVLGSQQQIDLCLRSEDFSALVSHSPWHKGPQGRDLENLRLVNLGRLTALQRRSVAKTFARKRKALAATAMAAMAVANGSVAPQMEMEQLVWTNSQSLFQQLQSGQTPTVGEAGRPLRGFLCDLLREGLSQDSGQRFREFCHGSFEVLAPMPHCGQLMPRLVREAGL
ncbi:unnamed protein product [Effrenium voratum]|nr:unnamed protein product [Effrenium voratum]